MFIVYCLMLYFEAYCLLRVSFNFYDEKGCGLIEIVRFP